MNLPTQIRQAEEMIRDVLHVHGLDPATRAHLAEATAHLREAFIGVNEGTAKPLDEFHRAQTDFVRFTQALHRLP